MNGRFSIGTSTTRGVHIFLRHFSHQHFWQSPAYYAEFLTRSFWRFPLASCSPLSPYYFLNVFRGLTLLCSSIFAGCLLLSSLDVIRVPSHQIEFVPCLKADHVKTQNYFFCRKALLGRIYPTPPSPHHPHTTRTSARCALLGVQRHSPRQSCQAVCPFKVRALPTACEVYSDHLKIIDDVILLLVR